MDAANSKSDLRTRARSTRAALSAPARDAASRVIAQAALALPEMASAHSVLVYVALPDEVDPTLAIEALARRGVRIAVPRVHEPGRLTLHWLDRNTTLAPGAFGIHEPAADSPSADPLDIDVALVPGVAFDARCCRLGFGGGFYDELLPRLRADALKVGLAFDEQVVSEVPREEHDVVLDAVVTPTAVHRRT